jgi:hypothetical protein
MKRLLSACWRVSFVVQPCLSAAHHPPLHPLHTSPSSRPIGQTRRRDSSPPLLFMVARKFFQKFIPINTLPGPIGSNSSPLTMAVEKRNKLCGARSCFDQGISLRRGRKASVAQRSIYDLLIATWLFRDASQINSKNNQLLSFAFGPEKGNFLFWEKRWFAGDGGPP